MAANAFLVVPHLSAEAMSEKFLGWLIAVLVWTWTLLARIVKDFLMRKKRWENMAPIITPS